MDKKKVWLLTAVSAAACAGLACFAVFGIHRHDWQPATCTVPETCAGCGETQGDPLGHSWGEATCVLPATCSVCGETEGDPLGHTWTEANFQTAAVCSVCGESGDPLLTGWFEQNGIECGGQENTAYPYRTATYTDPEQKTDGIVIMSGCRALKEDETHPAREGYEWITARFEVVLANETAWMNGYRAAWYYTDYYDPDLLHESLQQLAPAVDEENGEEEEKDEEEEGPTVKSFTVNCNGSDYDQCVGYFTDTIQDVSRYALARMEFDAWFLVPEGYDGMTVMFADSAYGVEEYITEGQPLEDVDGLIQSSTFIRLDPSRSAASDEDLPEMAVLAGILPVQAGQTLESGTVIRSSPKDQAGFYGLEKVSELADYDLDAFADRAAVCTPGTLPEGTELLGSLELPQEEGVYEVTAAARSKDGSAVTAVLTLLVDGTGPQIRVPKTNITLRGGQTYDFLAGVTVEDGFCPAGYCTLYMNAEELEALQAAAGAGQSGTYPLTYGAQDMAGNVTEKTIQVTLSLGGGSQRPAGGGTGQQPQTPEEGRPAGEGTTPETPAATPAPPPSTPEPTPAQFMEGMAREALGIVNQYRTAEGLAELAWNDGLYASAQIRAQELVTLFSHTRPDGTSCFTAMSGFSTYAENIAMGYASAGSVCTGWYNSQGHHDNMLNGNFTNAAIACWYQDGTYYWVNLFGG